MLIRTGSDLDRFIWLSYGGGSSILVGEWLNLMRSSYLRLITLILTTQDYLKPQNKQEG